MEERMKNVRVIRLLPPETAQLDEVACMEISEKAAEASFACGVTWVGESPVIRVTQELKDYVAAAPVEHLLTLCPYRGDASAIGLAADQAGIPRGVIVDEVMVFPWRTVRTG